MGHHMSSRTKQYAPNALSVGVPSRFIRDRIRSTCSKLCAEVVHVSCGETCSIVRVPLVNDAMRDSACQETFVVSQERLMRKLYLSRVASLEVIDSNIFRIAIIEAHGVLEATW